MFNTNNTPDTKAELKENTAQFIDNTKEKMSELSTDAKQSASKLGSKIQEKSREVKHDAIDLVDSLKALITKNTARYDAASIESGIIGIKNQVADKAVEWKNVIQDEVTHAVETSKAQTEKVVREQPLVSLAVAVGAGVLIGYLLGSKSNK